MACNAGQWTKSECPNERSIAEAFRPNLIAKALIIHPGQDGEWHPTIGQHGDRGEIPFSTIMAASHTKCSTVNVQQGFLLFYL
jgi:hypothetical protein